MPTELLEAIAKYVLPHIHYLRITGFNGEPMSYPHFDDFMKELVDRDIDVQITTNGTLIDKDRAKLISDVCSSIDISIEGVGASYTRIRGYKWENIKKKIEMLSNARDASSTLKIVLDVTLLYENLNDYESLFETTKNLGIDGIRLRHYYPVLHSQVSQSLLYNMRESNEFFDRMKELSLIYGVPLDLPPYFPLQSLSTDLHELTKHIERMDCAIPWEGLAITPRGDIRVCCSGFVMGKHKASDKTLMHVWNNRAYRRLRQVINGPMAPLPCRKCSMMCRDLTDLVFPLQFYGAEIVNLRRFLAQRFPFARRVYRHIHRPPKGR